MKNPDPKNRQYASMTNAEVVTHIREHAKAWYRFDGWDIVVEQWSDDDIIENVRGASTLHGAIIRARRHARLQSVARNQSRAHKAPQAQAPTAPVATPTAAPAAPPVAPTAEAAPVAPTPVTPAPVAPVAPAAPPIPTHVSQGPAVSQAQDVFPPVQNAPPVQEAVPAG